MRVLRDGRGHVDRSGRGWSVALGGGEAGDGTDGAATGAAADAGEAVATSVLAAVLVVVPADEGRARSTSTASVSDAGVMFSLAAIRNRSLHGIRTSVGVERAAPAASLAQLATRRRANGQRTRCGGAPHLALLPLPARRGLYGAAANAWRNASSRRLFGY